MEQQMAAAQAGPGGAQTQYRSEAPPAPFQQPGASELIINNASNPVATCGYPSEVYLPQIRETPVQTADWSQGYGGKGQHPMYTTTASNYGNKPPSVHTVPTQFFARSQKFSEHLGECGMYRNFSLNTETDKSKV